MISSSPQPSSAKVSILCGANLYLRGTPPAIILILLHLTIILVIRIIESYKAF